MWSGKNERSASEVTAKSREKAFFVCQSCGREFSAKIQNVVRAVNNGGSGCNECARRENGAKKTAVAAQKNSLAASCPKAAAMWSGKNERSASEVAAKSRKKAIFVCKNCKQEFSAKIYSVVNSVNNGKTGCPVCAGQKVVPGINDLASKYPQIAAMWSSKNKRSASEITVGSREKAILVCPDCGKEFKAAVSSVVSSVNNNCTGCYDCNMRRINSISKPEWFYTRPMLVFAGENGIPNPFFDVRSIFGESSHLGLDFVDHIQKFIYEYNGKYPHANAAEKDRFKFEAVRKAGYKGIRVLEPGLEVLDPKYDIVMPEGFRDSGGKYNAEIMEEVGRKVIHLLEEIYGRKASPEIWALNNFKEFEVWYDANKKDLEANAQKNMKSRKTAAKKAA